MALTSTNTITGFGLSQKFSRVKDGFIRWVEQTDTRRIEPYRMRIAALHALSDQELQQLNLRRDDIELHVLSRFFYC